MGIKTQLDTVNTNKIQLRQNINFYLSHLSVIELLIIAGISQSLAENYSDSFSEWKNKTRDEMMKNCGTVK